MILKAGRQHEQKEIHEVLSIGVLVHRAQKEVRLEVSLFTESFLKHLHLTWCKSKVSFA